jgi:hypothetical protein
MQHSSLDDSAIDELPPRRTPIVIPLVLSVGTVRHTTIVGTAARAALPAGRSTHRATPFGTPDAPRPDR